MFASFRNGMASITGDTPAKNRTFTSPLHDMDGHEETAEANPTQSETTTQERGKIVKPFAVLSGGG